VPGADHRTGLIGRRMRGRLRVGALHPGGGDRAGGGSPHRVDGPSDAGEALWPGRFIRADTLVPGADHRTGLIGRRMRGGFGSGRFIQAEAIVPGADHRTGLMGRRMRGKASVGRGRFIRDGGRTGSRGAGSTGTGAWMGLVGTAGGKAFRGPGAPFNPGRKGIRAGGLDPLGPGGLVGAGPGRREEGFVGRGGLLVPGRGG